MGTVPMAEGYRHSVIQAFRVRIRRAKLHFHTHLVFIKAKDAPGYKPPVLPGKPKTMLDILHDFAV